MKHSVSMLAFADRQKPCTGRSRSRRRRAPGSRPAGFIVPHSARSPPRRPSQLSAAGRAPAPLLCKGLLETIGGKNSRIVTV